MKSSSQRIQDLLRANVSGTLIREGQYARAASELEQVLAHGVDAYPARRHRMLSLAYSKMNRPRDALDAATKAVELCKGDESFCIDALGRRAAAHAALGDAPAALADINAALELIEGLRIRLVPTDFFKQDFNHAQSYIYSQAIALQVQQKQERQALETAELARARAFLDLLASRDVQLKDRDRRCIAALAEGRHSTSAGAHRSARVESAVSHRRRRSAAATASRRPAVPNRRATSSCAASCPRLPRPPTI